MADRPAGAVVVAGASSGIGAAAARALAARGFPVVLAARRERQLAETASLCRAAGAAAIAVAGDMTRRSDVERLRDAALTSFGVVSAWVNNVGRGISRKVDALTDGDFDSMLEVNLKSALYGMQAILPHFREQKRGVIINVNSILGRVPYVLRGGYCAAKHALLGLTGCLRQELAAEGWNDIHVCSVLPGPVETGFSLAAEGIPGNSDRMVRVRERFLRGSGDYEWLRSQTAEEVAAILVEAIFEPRAEIYTAPSVRDHALAYVGDPDLREEHMRPIARMILGRDDSD